MKNKIIVSKLNYNNIEAILGHCVYVRDQFCKLLCVYALDYVLLCIFCDMYPTTIEIIQTHHLFKQSL